MINYSETNKELYNTLTQKIYSLILSQPSKQNLPNDDFINSILLIAIDLELFNYYDINDKYILARLNDTYTYYYNLNVSELELAQHLANSLFDLSEMIKRFSKVINEYYSSDSVQTSDDGDFILANEYPPYLSEPHKQIIEKESQQETNIDIISIQNAIDYIFINTLDKSEEEENSLEL